MKRNYLQIMTWKQNGFENEINHKSHFATAEKAIEDSKKCVNNSEWKEYGRTILKVEIINKETKEVIWKYEAA